MIPPDDALARLREGNERFVAGLRGDGGNGSPPLRLVRDQAPFAIILGCSDSRVPAEIVFDQGLGDLFVIRVAGNVVAPSQVGSVEFAASQFGTRLVVVLGHANCGAVIATIDELRQPADRQSPNLRSIVDRVRPAVESVLEENGADEKHLIERAVRANVLASMRNLADGSEILRNLVGSGELRIIGAEYCLETGVVEFLDED